MIETAIIITVIIPLLLTFVLGFSSFLKKPLGERLVGNITQGALLVSSLAAWIALFEFLFFKEARKLSLGQWFSTPEGGFSITFLIDGYSLGFCAFSVSVCYIVAIFSHRYLHQDPGYYRYFRQLGFFVSGMVLVILAGSMELLFVGWELLGLSSVLLVGFYHERRAPLQNAMRIFGIYRIGDISLLSATVLFHYWFGTGNLSLLFSENASVALAGNSVSFTFIILLVLLAAAAKSALVPFSGWLPRAMEGPTPSSAVYYGCLSIHAGCFLLLRAGPLLETSLFARVCAGLLGILTAVYATLCTRVQSDVKSELAFAALTQVGVIVLEISFGFYSLAFLHIIGHASYRLFQLLNAPNILHEIHEMENALRTHFRSPQHFTSTSKASKFHKVVYLFALQRGYLDSVIEFILEGVLFKLGGFFNSLDRQFFLFTTPDRNRTKSLEKR